MSYSKFYCRYHLLHTTIYCLIQVTVKHYLCHLPKANEGFDDQENQIEYLLSCILDCSSANVVLYYPPKGPWVISGNICYMYLDRHRWFVCYNDTCVFYLFIANIIIITLSSVC